MSDERSSTVVKPSSSNTALHSIIDDKNRSTSSTFFAAADMTNENDGSTTSLTNSTAAATSSAADMTNVNRNSNFPSTKELLYNNLLTTGDNNWAMILKLLVCNEFTFTLNDILKYSIISITTLIVLIYLTPAQLVILLLFLLFIVLCLIRTLISAKNYKTTEQFLVDKPIDPNKLQAFRKKLLINTKTPQDSHNINNYND